MKPSAAERAKSELRPARSATGPNGERRRGRRAPRASMPPQGKKHRRRRKKPRLWAVSIAVRPDRRSSASVAIGVGQFLDDEIGRRLGPLSRRKARGRNFFDRFLGRSGIAHVRRSPNRNWQARSSLICGSGSSGPNARGGRKRKKRRSESSSGMASRCREEAGADRPATGRENRRFDLAVENLAVELFPCRVDADDGVERFAARRTAASRVARTAASAITSTSRREVPSVKWRGQSIAAGSPPAGHGSVMQMVGLGRREQDLVDLRPKQTSPETAAPDPKGDHTSLIAISRSRSASGPEFSAANASTTRSGGRAGRNGRGKRDARPCLYRLCSGAPSSTPASRWRRRLFGK